MFSWMARRTLELILAFLVVAAVLWAVVTQPMLAPTTSTPLLRLDAKKLETNMLALGEFKGPFTDAEDSVVLKTADFLTQKLDGLGTLESKGFSSNLHQINLQIGKVQVDATNPEFPIAHPRLVLVIHHVLSEQSSWDGAKALAGMIELATRLDQVAKANAEFALEITIFLHHAQQLSQTIMTATEAHMDQLVRSDRSNDRVLVWMPGILLPDAYTSASHWGFLAPAVPDDNSDVQLYSRLADFNWLRHTKELFKKADIAKAESLTVPSSFPKVSRFPLNTYWDRDIQAMLLRTRLVGVSQDYADLMRLLTALEQVLQQPVEIPKALKEGNKSKNPDAELLPPEAEPTAPEVQPAEPQPTT